MTDIRIGSWVKPVGSFRMQGITTTAGPMMPKRWLVVDIFGEFAALKRDLKNYDIGSVKNNHEYMLWALDQLELIE